MKKDDFDGIVRSLKEAIAHARDKDNGCVIHHKKIIKKK